MTSNKIRLTSSAPLSIAVFAMIESLCEDQHRSPLFREAFYDARGTRPEDAAVVAALKEVIMSSSAIDGLRQTDLKKLAALSNSPGYFLQLAEAVLEPEAFASFQQSFLYLVPICKELFWNKSRAWIHQQEHKLNSEIVRLEMTKHLGSVLNLVQAEWPYAARETFVLVPVPYPTKSGSKQIMGSSYGAVQELELLQETADVSDQLDVVFHELVHTCFGAMPANFKERLWRKYAAIDGTAAFFLLNECMATALGQGWFNNDIAGKEPLTPWYSPAYKYVDSYAHAMLPLFKQYLQSATCLDEDFAVAATKLLADTFAGSLHDPGTLLWDVLVLTGTEGKFAETLFQLVPHGNSRGLISIGKNDGREEFAAERNFHSLVFAVTADQLAMVQCDYLPQLDLSAIATRKDSANGFLWCKKVDGQWVFLCVGETADEQVGALKQLLALEAVAESI